MCLYGLGDVHIDVLVSKLKSRFGTTVDTASPKVPYRETIKKKAQVEGKHKKQSGGHGQYGDVHIRFSPGETEGLTFEVSVVGGTVPKNFNPAVEKGLLESMQKGVLAGYPVVYLKADLYDGSYHPVDSSEMAFKIAGSLAFKDGMKKANPVLLEPIMKVEIVTPEDYFGDLMGNVSSRRGTILGTEDRNGSKVIDSYIPLSEMFGYATELRSRTQGRGQFTMQFDHFNECPKSIAEKIVGERSVKHDD